MSNSYLLFTPLLTLLVVALVGFVGCDLLFGLDEVPQHAEAPTNFTGVGKDMLVDLSWDPYPGADGFILYKALTANALNPAQIPIMDGMATGHQDPDVTNDVLVFYRLSAIVGTDTSYKSPQVEVTPGLSGVPVPFVEQTQLGSPRLFNAWMGMRFKTSSNALTLRSLGRWFDAGVTGSHQMRIAAVASPTVVRASVPVNQTVPGTAGGFVYAIIVPTIQLAADTEYFIVSNEQAAPDSFHDSDATRVTILHPEAGVEVRAAFGDDAGSYTSDMATGAAYGPVNFEFTIP